MQSSTDAALNGHSSAPSSSYLLARISTLRTTIVREFENILATADTSDQETESHTSIPLTDTASRQLTIDASTQTIIRAVEEFLVLSRRMKELWLFGGVRTLDEHGDDTKNAKETARTEEEAVVRGIKEWFDKNQAFLADGRPADNETKEDATNDA